METDEQNSEFKFPKLRLAVNLTTQKIYSKQNQNPELPKLTSNFPVQPPAEEKLRKNSDDFDPFSQMMQRDRKGSQYIKAQRKLSMKAPDVFNKFLSDNIAFVTRKRSTTIRGNKGKSGKDEQLLSKLRSIGHVFIMSEIARSQAREIAIQSKIELMDRKKRVILAFFESMNHVLDLPINIPNIQIKATELLGDILFEFKDYKNALFYYDKAVFFFSIFKKRNQ